jgi:translation initiation factor 1
VPREPETRLVYSTGGDVAKEAAPKAAAAKAERGGIKLRLERRASNRLVTIVTGLPGASGEVAALAKALKAACGAGGAVKGTSLELQGDQRDRVEAALAARGLRSKRAGGEA